jgi:hypothetical protein
MFLLWLRYVLDLIPMYSYARASESAESFARRLQDLHVEIIKQIQVSNAQNKLQADLRGQHNEFKVGDYIMI